MKTVRPNWAKGYNMSWTLNIFNGPKWTINCGNCSNTFKKRIDVVNQPAVVCPFCGAVNKLNLMVSR